MPQCEEHTQLIADVAVIKNDISYIRTRVCEHIDEGEKQGGFRDRVLVLERELGHFKAWIFVAGVLGGLVGKLTPDVISFLLKCVFANQ